jgi:TP901 family phage tail tape measure protein
MAQLLGEAYVELSAIDKGLTSSLESAEQSFKKIFSSIGNSFSMFSSLASSSFQTVATIGKSTIQGLSNSLNAAQGASNTLATTLGVVLVGALAAVAINAPLVDQSIGQITDGLGLMETQANQAATAARDLWSGAFTVDLQTATQSVLEIGWVFGDFATRTQNQIYQLTRDISLISTATQTTAGDVSGATKTMMTYFDDLKGKEKEVLDMLTWGMQNGGKSLGNFAGEVQKLAPLLSDLGFSGREAFNYIMASAKDGGFQVQEMAQNMQRVRQQLLNVTDDTKKALANIGINAKELKQIQADIAKGGEAGRIAIQNVMAAISHHAGTIKGQKASIQLMGDEWTKSEAKALTALQNMSSNVNHTKGAVDQLRQNQQGIGTDFQRITANLGRMAGALALLGGGGSSILAPIADALERAAKGTEAFINAWNQSGSFLTAFQTFFSPTTQVVIVGVAGAILGGLIPAIWGMITAGWTWVTTVAPGLISSFFAASAAILPWIAIGALVAAVAYLIWTNWDTVSKWLSEAWTWLCNLGKSLFNGLLNFFKQWGIYLLGALFGPIGLLAAFMVSNWNKISSTTKQVWNAVVNWLKSTWDKAKNWAKSIWTGVTDAIANAWNNLKSKAASIWSGIFSTISRWINKALNAIRPFIRGFNNMVSKVNSLTGSSIPTISMPGLAKGGIVTAPTMAVVGEGRYSEAVLPLSDKTFSALAAGITQNMSGGKGTTIHVHANKANINERDLANIFRRTEWLMGV